MIRELTTGAVTVIATRQHLPAWRGLACAAVAAMSGWWSLGPLPAADQPPRDEPLRWPAQFWEWVRIGHAGNRPDDSGLGDVNDDFMLGKFEVTNEQFCGFLNATVCGRENRDNIAWRDNAARPLGPAKSSLHDVEPFEQAQHHRQIGIIYEPEPDGTFRYRPGRAMALKPVVNLRWCDAARFANWLHNGATEDADTESGAYVLDANQFSDTYAVVRQPDARYWIPSLDEWYKAAYFDPSAGANGVYRDYPTRSGQAPKRVAGWAPDGVGMPPRNGGTDAANFDGHAKWWRSSTPARDTPTLCNVTTIRTNGGANRFQAFDMAGNAAELVTVRGPGADAFFPMACGGDYLSDASAMKRTTIKLGMPQPKLPTTGGLRLARLVHDDDPPQRPGGRRQAAQDMVRRLLGMRLPDRIAGRATEAAFAELRADLDKALADCKGHGPVPAWAQASVQDAIKAIYDAELLAKKRDDTEEDILRNALVLNVPPQDPAIRLAILKLNEDFQRDLLVPYNKLENIKKTAQAATENNP